MQQKKGAAFYILFINFFLLVLGTSGLNAQLYYHNFGNVTINTHPYVVAPNTIHPNLSNSAWTNSKASWTSGVGAPPGQAIQVNTTAGTTNIYLTFTVTPNYQATITSFNFWRQRSNSGPQNWELLINGISVATGTTPTAGAATGVTNLATPISVGGNVTVELALTNATGGNFRLDDFTINGTVASTCSGIAVTSFTPVNGPVGTKVTITGSGFTGASAVKFNGINATSYNVISDTEIEAIVPANGTTGKIDVFNAQGCNGSSTGNVTVLTSQCSTPQAPTPDIFISEVYDQKSGSGGMIELYNPTASTITFNGQYRLLRYGDIEDDTPTAGYNLVLPGSIGPNSTLLLYGTAPVQSTCATPPSTIQFGNGFNGNDKFELLKGGNVIDVAHITSAAAGFTTRRKPTAIAPKNVFDIADWDIVVHGTAPDPSYCADLGVFNLPTPPTVTPVATKTICAGTNTTFTSTLSNPAGYSYQWKTLNAAGIWVNVANGGSFSGATTATLTITSAPVGLDDTQYYCEMTSVNCNVKSSAAQLYVILLDPPVLTQTPPTCTTTTGSITVDPVTGATYSKNGTTFQASNVFTGLAPGPYTITIKVGNCTASNTITVDPAPSAPAQPQLSQTPPTCTTATGTITVTAVAGLEYSLDGGAYQTSNEFTSVNPGLHTVTVKNAAGCTASNTITIDPAPSAPAQPQLSQTPPTCTTSTGTITVTAIAGLEYSLDGGAYQTSNEFTGVNPGLHTVTVKNAAGCTASNTITVEPAPNAPAQPQLSQTPPTCTTSTGTITVTAVAGLEYSLDGGAYQTSNEFTGVNSGPHTITVKNAAGCTASNTITVDPAPSAPAQPQLSQIPPTCTTPTGTITVTAVAGLEYRLDGGAYQTSNEFTGVNPGPHTVTVKNPAGCTASNTITVDPAPNSPAQPQLSQTPPTCTTATGAITVTAVAGLEYSLDGGAYQTSNEFTGVNPGPHTITVKNPAGCTASNTITVDPAPNSPAQPQLSQTPPTCTISTGTITVTAVAGLEYSLDGGAYQASNEFTGVNPGLHAVTVKNVAGCTASNIISVGNAPASPTIVSIARQHPTCTTSFGKITITAQGTGLEYSLGGPFQTGNEFINVSPGSYQVTVKNADGCEDFGSAIIDPVPPTPVKPVAMATQPTCTTAASITVTAVSGTGIEYRLDGGAYQASNIFSNVGAGSHTVTVRNSAGCDNISDPVVVNPIPATPAVPQLAQTPPTCTTTTGSITVTAVAGLEYRLDSGTYQASNSFGNVTPGLHTVTIRNAEGCTASNTITVGNAPATPAQPQLSQTPPVCNGTTGSITVAGVAGLEYSLDGGVYQSSNTFTGIAPGPHTVTVKNGAGCTASNTITVGNAPATPSKPVAVAIQPTCAAPAAVVNVTPVSGPGITYSLSGGLYQASTIFSNVAAGTHTVTVRNAAGCTNTSDPIVVNPAPAIPAKPVAVPTQPTCAAPNATITVNPLAGTGIAYSLNNGPYQSSNIFNVNAGTYTVTVKNSDGCTRISDPVTINTSPAAPLKPVATAIQPTCTIADGRITVNPVAGTGIMYSLNGGPYQASNLFLNVPPGTYTVTVINIGGCTNVSDPITINSAPVAPDKPIATVTQPTCANPVASIAITPVAGTGNTYSLDNGPYQTGLTFNNITPGTHIVTVKNATGCTRASDPVIVNPAPTQANAGTITGNADVCEGNTLQLQNTASGGIWASSNTTVATVSQNGRVNGLTPGTTLITYTVPGQCPAQTSKTITVHEKPELSLKPEYYLCVDNVSSTITPKMLFSGVSGAGYTFVWRKNGTLLPVNTSFITVNEPGTYTITATNSVTGCSVSAGTVVGTSSIAVASATVGIDFENYQVININVTGGTGDYEYSLDGEDWQDEPYFRGHFEGEYTIQIRDKHECGTATVEVLALNYPRFFTPNGDGVNDTWNIKGVFWQNTRIYIFDRYGKLISEVRPGVLGWDGTYNGHRLPATDYWFTMKYTSRSGEAKELKAHFTLKR
ncbi:MAG: T9SS type B sorting domain-containing protein [Flavobacterium sp.]